MSIGTTAVGAVRAIQNPTAGLAPSSDAALINEYIATNFPTSPLRGHGQDFVDAVNQYAPTTGSAPLLAAIAVQESGAGTKGRGATGNNPFNLGPGLAYPTVRAGIFAAAHTIAARSPSGWDPVNIGPWYAPSSVGNDTAAWIRGVELLTTQIQKSVPPSGPQGGTSGPNSPPFSGPGPGGTDAGVAKPVSLVPDVLGGVSSLLSLLGALLDPHNFLRLGEDVVGVLGLAGAAAAIIKGRTALGLGLAMGGYVFLYAGVKDVSPLAQVRDAFRPASAGKAPASSASASAGAPSFGLTPVEATTPISGTTPATGTTGATAATRATRIP